MNLVSTFDATRRSRSRSRWGARRRLAAGALGVALAAALGAGAARGATVTAVITADNAYGFGYGSLTSLSATYGGVENCTAADIFSCATGPETYSGVPAPTGSYLYIIAYSDNATTQGVLGDFIAGLDTTATGTANFEVFATGQDINPDCGGPSNFPSLATINAQIALANANAGGAGSSVGWVGPSGGPVGTVGALAIGEDNQSLSRIDFPIVCDIAGDAHWMWYNPQPGVITDAFRTGPTPPDEPAGAGEFLIFRIASDVVTPTRTSSWGSLKAIYR